MMCGFSRYTHSGTGQGEVLEVSRGAVRDGALSTSRHAHVAKKRLTFGRFVSAVGHLVTLLLLLLLGSGLHAATATISSASTTSSNVNFAHSWNGAILDTGTTNCFWLSNTQSATYTLSSASTVAGFGISYPVAATFDKRCMIEVQVASLWSTVIAGGYLTHNNGAWCHLVMSCAAKTIPLTSIRDGLQQKQRTISGGLGRIDLKSNG